MRETAHKDLIENFDPKAPCRRFARMDRADEYRKCAAECLRLATRAVSDERRAILLEMSELWLTLAEFAERTIERSGGQTQPRR